MQAVRATVSGRCAFVAPNSIWHVVGGEALLRLEGLDDSGHGVVDAGVELVSAAVMEAVRVAFPCDDPLGEKVMLKYLTKKVEAQEAKEANRARIGFV